MGKQYLASTMTLDAEAIRLQLDRLLHSSQFRNSKRCQSLLRYVVEETVDGHCDQLKERTIGVEVFGRQPTYDTNQDAVVRNAAVEVRKRLAQYYMDPAHENDLRIDLPPGAYAPEFPPHTALIAVEREAAPVVPARRSFEKRWAFGALFLAGAAAMSLATVHFWPRTADADLMKFWAPILDGPEVVQICIGQPRRVFRFNGPRRNELEEKLLDEGRLATQISPAEISRAGSELLYFRDAYAMAHMTGLLQSKNKPFRLRNDATASFSELRRSPVIAIGAYNNLWTMRLTSELRYSFANETIDGVRYNYIRDREHPADRSRRLKWRPMFGAQEEDFLIVTRVLASDTERTVVSVAGFSDYGTLAAGEFATDAAYLREAFRNAPKDWEKKNIQLVLHTKMIEGTPGPATVVATDFR